MRAGGGEAKERPKDKMENGGQIGSPNHTRRVEDAMATPRPGGRHIGIANLGGNPAHATVTYVTAGNGTNIEPHWSADDKYLVDQHTDTRNSADFYTIEAKGSAKPTRLSDSMPEGGEKKQV